MQISPYTDIFTTTPDLIIIVDTIKNTAHPNPSVIKHFGLYQSKNDSPLDILLQDIGIQDAQDFLVKAEANIYRQHHEKEVINWSASYYAGGILLLGRSYPSYDNDTVKILLNIFENIPCNIYWMDSECKMLGANKRVLDILNMDISEYRGLDYKTLAKRIGWPLDLVEKYENDDKKVIKTGKPLLNLIDPPIPNVDGKDFYQITNRIPLKDDAGNIIGVAGISVDISELQETRLELKKALALAEQSEEKRKEFLKNQEHDINTAISGIEYASVIMESSDDLDAIHYAAKEITVCAKRLKNYNKTLIKDLAWLDGEGKVVEQRMSIRDVCSNLYGLNHLSAKNKGISFIVNIADEIPDYFMGDEMILFQSLQNIVANAIQFTEEGTIELAVNIVEQCYKNDDCMLLAFHVKDTGRGIDAKHQRYIFDDFFKVVPSNEPDLISGVQADQDKGRGLGLTLSKKYIETMGGELHLHKSELGVGSEFVATLPLKVALNQQKPS